MIWGILVFLITFFADAETDLKRWGKPEGKGGVNHLRGAFLRAPGLVLAAYFSMAKEMDFHSLHSWLRLVAWLGVYGSIFWIFFDEYLAWRKKLPLFYVGKTAWIDKLFQRIGPKWMPAAKGLLVAVMIAFLRIVTKRHKSQQNDKQ